MRVVLALTGDRILAREHVACSTTITGLFLHFVRLLQRFFVGYVLRHPEGEAAKPTLVIARGLNTEAVLQPMLKIVGAVSTLFTL